jgi:hypothetical protein
VRVREGGQVLQTVHDDRGCFVATLGGHDGRTLYLVPGVAQRLQHPHRPGARPVVVPAARTGSRPP